MDKKVVAVVDGQGGGIGRALVEQLRAALKDRVEIWALGTNSRATEQMLRAGADEGATGENAVCYNAGRADVIVGVLAILMANGLMGELSPSMASAISSAPAHKVLIPLNRCNIQVVGAGKDTLPQMIASAVQLVEAYLA